MSAHLIESLYQQLDATRAENANLREALDSANALADAMETCHICQGILVLDDTPVHCENCSWHCDEHDEPACQTIDTLHAAFRIKSRAALASTASAVPEAKEKHG